MQAADRQTTQKLSQAPEEGVVWGRELVSLTVFDKNLLFKLRLALVSLGDNGVQSVLKMFLALALMVALWPKPLVRPGLNNPTDISHQSDCRIFKIHLTNLLSSTCVRFIVGIEHLEYSLLTVRWSQFLRNCPKRVISWQTGVKINL